MSAHNVRPVSADPDALAAELCQATPQEALQIRRLALSPGRTWALDNVPTAARAALSREIDPQQGLVVRAGNGLIISAEQHHLQYVASLLASLGEAQAAALGHELLHALQAPHSLDGRRLTVRDKVLEWGKRTFVMGILNVTPDSFSGDGILAETHQTALVDAAVSRALGFVRDGADIIDVGGESTRPGAEALDARTEAERVLPVISALRAETDAIISIDTYKADVAAAALDAGADIVNDVWALGMDPAMAPLVSERRVPVILMHNRSKPKDAAQQARLGGRYVGVRYENLIADVLRELRERIGLAGQHGIPETRIIVDPGIGFGKTVGQNLYLVNHLDDLRVLGLPILLGPSRKSFIGYTLDLPPDQRLEGTAATVAVGIARGANIVRVHDVLAMTRVTHMVDAITRATLEP